jgi:alanine racemase
MNDYRDKTNGTWVDIDMDALTHNLNEVRRLAGKQMLCAVVKADGYGHGAIACARHFQEHGVERFAVASITEALELRFSGISQPILILGWTPDHRAEDLIKHQLTPTIFRQEQAKLFSSAAAAHHQALKLHIKVDTGMNRLGLPPTLDAVTEIAAISRLPFLEIEGVFTHLALFFTDDNRFSLQQADRFLDFMKQLERAGISIPLRHIANSAGLLDVPGDDFNLVRVGSALYGLNPRAGIPRDQMNIRPAMTFKTVISHVKTVPAGQGISYGHTYTTSSTTRVATIPVGYVDGITKIGSGRTKALVRGERVPQIGMICMDQCMLDVSQVPEAVPGDEVIFFGTDGTHTISPDERAEILGTGNCEIVCAVSRRVPRIYWSGGRVMNAVNYVTDPLHGE